MRRVGARARRASTSTRAGPASAKAGRTPARGEVPPRRRADLGLQDRRLSPESAAPVSPNRRGCAATQLRTPAATHANMCSPMTSDGSPYSRFQRAIRSGNLALIHATAAELPYVPLPTRWRSCSSSTPGTRSASTRPRCAGPAGWRPRRPGSSWPSSPARCESLVALPDEHAQSSLLALAGRARRPAGAPAPPVCGGVRSSRGRGGGRSPRYRAQLHDVTTRA